MSKINYRKRVISAWRLDIGSSTTGKCVPSFNHNTYFEAELECGHILTGYRKSFPKTMRCCFCEEEKKENE